LRHSATFARTHIVMRGLDPRIHALIGVGNVMDGRVKPGHDE